MKSHFSRLLTMEEFPSFAENIFFIPRPKGPGKENTVVNLSHTHEQGGGYSVYLDVCLLAQVSCHVSVLRRLTATLNTRIFTQDSWCGVHKFLR